VVDLSISPAPRIGSSCRSCCSRREADELMPYRSPASITSIRRRACGSAWRAHRSASKPHGDCAALALLDVPGRGGGKAGW
jgi:hypothetical protein